MTGMGLKVAVFNHNDFFDAKGDSVDQQRLKEAHRTELLGADIVLMEFNDIKAPLLAMKENLNAALQRDALAMRNFTFASALENRMGTALRVADEVDQLQGVAQTTKAEYRPGKAGEEILKRVGIEDAHAIADQALLIEFMIADGFIEFIKADESIERTDGRWEMAEGRSAEIINYDNIMQKGWSLDTANMKDSFKQRFDAWLEKKGEAVHDSDMMARTIEVTAQALIGVQDTHFNISPDARTQGQNNWIRPNDANNKTLQTEQIFGGARRALAYEIFGRARFAGLDISVEADYQKVASKVEVQTSAVTVSVGDAMKRLQEIGGYDKGFSGDAAGAELELQTLFGLELAPGFEGAKGSRFFNSTVVDGNFHLESKLNFDPLTGKRVEAVSGAGNIGEALTNARMIERLGAEKTGYKIDGVAYEAGPRNFLIQTIGQINTDSVRVEVSRQMTGHPEIADKSLFVIMRSDQKISVYTSFEAFKEGRLEGAGVETFEMGEKLVVNGVEVELKDIMKKGVASTLGGGFEHVVLIQSAPTTRGTDQRWADTLADRNVHRVVLADLTVKFNDLGQALGRDRGLESAGEIMSALTTEIIMVGGREVEMVGKWRTEGNPVGQLVKLTQGNLINSVQSNLFGKTLEAAQSRPVAVLEEAKSRLVRLLGDADAVGGDAGRTAVTGLIQKIDAKITELKREVEKAARPIEGSTDAVQFLNVTMLSVQQSIIRTLRGDVKEGSVDIIKEIEDAGASNNLTHAELFSQALTSLKTMTNVEAKRLLFEFDGDGRLLSEAGEGGKKTFSDASSLVDIVDALKFQIKRGAATDIFKDIFREATGREATERDVLPDLQGLTEGTKQLVTLNGQGSTTAKVASGMAAARKAGFDITRAVRETGSGRVYEAAQTAYQLLPRGVDHVEIGKGLAVLQRGGFGFTAENIGDVIIKLGTEVRTQNGIPRVAEAIVSLHKKGYNLTTLTDVRTGREAVTKILEQVKTDTTGEASRTLGSLVVAMPVLPIEVQQGFVEGFRGLNIKTSTVNLLLPVMFTRSEER